MRKRLEAVLAATVLTLSMFSAAGPAQATSRQHRPAAALRVVHKRINAGHSPQFRYSTKLVPGGARIELQRQYGTGHVWKNVRRLTAATGTVTAPKLPQLGRYAYRVAVTKNHRYVVASKSQYVYVYGKVSFSTICAGVSGCGGGTIEFGGHVHSYVYFGEADGYQYPDYANDLEADATSCDAMTLNFYGDQDAQSYPDTVYAQVTQERSDPASAQAGPGIVGTLNVRLDGSVWYLDVAYASDYNSDVLVDASSYAHCYTASGSR
jgi:hypothetical protein